LNGLELQFNAYDEDTVQDEWLGTTEPIPWQDFVENSVEIVHQVKLHDKKFKNIGTLKYKTKFVFLDRSKSPTKSVPLK
jgi:hypothetical protein